MISKHSRSRTWFTMRVRAGVYEINVYDDIGVFGVTAESFRQSLDERPFGMPVRVRINSQGGDPFTAVAILNMLRALDEPVEVIIDGIAASAASVIAMAGDPIRMPSNSMLMIHGASQEVGGNAEDMREAAEALDKVNSILAGVYAARSGLTMEAVLALMDSETFMTAEEAVELGFADEVTEPLKVAATVDARRYGKPSIGIASTEKGGSAATAREGLMTTKTEKAAAETPEQIEARIRAEVKAQMDADAKTAREAAEAAAAADAGTETAEQIEARVRDGIVAEAKQINAICVLAGVPERAAGYVAEGKKLADVVASLEADAASGKIGKARGRGDEISARMLPANGQASPEIEDRLDPTRIYNKWNGRASA